MRGHSQSTLFSGSPSNYVQLRFNALPAESATARFNFTLLHFRQNGTKADGTTPIYYRTAAVPIGVQAPTLVTGTQIYTIMLDLPASLNCGNPAGRSTRQRHELGIRRGRGMARVRPCWCCSC